MSISRASCLCLTALALLATGCGDGDDTDGGGERSDPPVKPPAGWRSIENEPAGFSLSIPRSWSAQTKRGATLLRPRDKLIVITVAADRGESARELDAAAYARRMVESLPGFEGSLAAEAPRVAGSPYRSARIDGLGRVSSSRRSQRITVAVFQRPGRVTYAAVVFRNPKVDARVYEPRLRRVLRSFRARPASG